jgi:hypothetical protein
MYATQVALVKRLFFGKVQPSSRAGGALRETPDNCRIDSMDSISMRVTCLLVAMLAAGQTAQAQAAADASPPLKADLARPQDAARPLAFVSVESALPWLTGKNLRLAIRKQSGFEVISPAEAGVRGHGAPAANAPVMVITISRRSEVTLVCRSAPEGFQWIRVKTPIRSVMDATAALAAAVLSAAYGYQAKLAELQRGALEREALAQQRELSPAAAPEIPGNPYYRFTPGVPSRPYLPPYNPYYLPRFNPLTSPHSI